MNLSDKTKFPPRNVEGKKIKNTTGDRINNHDTHAKRGIGVFSDYQTTEKALIELENIGYDMGHISVIGQDSEQLNQSGQTGETQVKNTQADDDGNHAEEGAKTGAVSGVAVGGLAGLLVGLGTLAIPGVGPIMLAGTAATAIATTLAGGAIGAAAGGLVGALVGLGIPEERAEVYNEHLSRGQYLVMVDGTDAEIARAEAILKRRGIREWGVYDVPTAGSAVVNQTHPVEPVAGQTASPTDAKTVKLHEERLVVDKNRQKTGEVSLGKHTETDTVQVSTPVEKERVVVVSVPLDGEKVTTSTGDSFDDRQETARVEVFEETPHVHKETFVREEVGIAKETTHKNVNTEETLRREELDVDSQGRPMVDNRTHRPNQNRR